MVYINEWLPNPIGNDANGEFIELYNSGNAEVSLNGYALGDGTKKNFSLAGYVIPAQGYLVFNKSQSKLSLKNTDGGLSLYGPDGNLMDEAHFSGAASEGKSFARVDYGNAPVGHFVFEYPTPGVANKPVDDSVLSRDYPYGVSLVRQLGAGAFMVLMFGVAFFFLVFFMYVTRNNRNISHFLFGGDKEAGV
jgi:hypothetical protein